MGRECSAENKVAEDIPSLSQAPEISLHNQFWLCSHNSSSWASSYAAAIIAQRVALPPFNVNLRKQSHQDTGS
jgi:hypothetical protein